jgi:hypothetical protein
MRYALCSLVLLIVATNSKAQITTASNGLNTPSSSTVQLGGTLLQTTNIDLGNYDFHILKGSNKYFSIVNNGNVGIGYPNPTTLLSLGNSVANAKLAIWEGVDGNGVVGRTGFGIGYGQFRFFLSGAAGKFSFLPDENSSSEVMTVMGTGNVGIGTSNPGALLSLGNTVTNAKFALWEGTSGGVTGRMGMGVGSGQFRLFLAGVNNRFSFLSDEAGSNEVMTILNAGNVGIGTVTPDAKLHVYDGNFRLSGPNNDGVEVTTMRAWNLNYYTVSAKTLGNGIAAYYTPASDGVALPYVMNFATDITPHGRSGLMIGGYNGKHMISVDGTGTEQWDLVFRNAPSGTDWANAPDVFTIKSGAPGNSFFVNGAGSIGIGTPSPSEKLEVIGSIKASGFVLSTGAGAGKVLTSDAGGNATWQTVSGLSAAGWSFGGNAVSASSSIGTTSNYDLPFVTNNIERMRIGANGAVGIGTANINDAGYKLFVEGNIRTRKVRVDQQIWADYVFEHDYKLRSLQEVEQYIQEQKHLPEVPSAAAVKQEGVDLGDNQVVLLKKIEELTLYIIQQQKQLQAQQQRIEVLEQKLIEKK